MAKTQSGNNAESLECVLRYSQDKTGRKAEALITQNPFRRVVDRFPLDAEHKTRQAVEKKYPGITYVSG